MLNTLGRCSSGRSPVRLAWASSVASQCGRKRTGRRRVGIGERRVRQVDELAAGLVPVANEGQPFPAPPGVARPGSRPMSAMSRHGAGPNARRWARTRCASPSSSVASGGPTQSSASASRSARRRSQVPDGGTRTRSTQTLRLPTNPAPSSPSSLTVRGPSDERLGGGARLRRPASPRSAPADPDAERPGPARLAHAERVAPVLAPRYDVDRRPHERRLDDGPLLEGLGQRRTTEAGEPGPQPDVARRRVLRLEPADLLDGVLERDRRAFEQQLAGEQRAVEGAAGQDAFGHGSPITFPRAGTGPHRRCCRRTAADDDDRAPGGSRRSRRSGTSSGK